MSIIEIITLILTVASYGVGFLLPYIIRLITVKLKNDDEKVIITYMICFVAAMVVDYKALQHGDFVSLATWFAGINLQSQAMFKLYLQPKWNSQQTGE